jgi:hypothetical protein
MLRDPLLPKPPLQRPNLQTMRKNHPSKLPTLVAPPPPLCKTLLSTPKSWARMVWQTHITRVLASPCSMASQNTQTSWPINVPWPTNIPRAVSQPMFHGQLTCPNQLANPCSMASQNTQTGQPIHIPWSAEIPREVGQSMFHRQPI